MNWIETHGFEALIFAYLYSLCTSAMPPMPISWNWWATWMYNIAQITGANLQNLVKNVPAGQQLEQRLSATQTKTLIASTTTEVAESPKA